MFLFISVTFRFRTCSTIGDLPFTCRLTRTISLDSSVYVMAPDGRVLEFKCPTLNKLVRNRCDSSNSASGGSEGSLSSLSGVSEIELPNESPNDAPAVQMLGKLRCRLPNFSQHHFEVIQYRGKILLVGGKTPDNNILKNIKVFDMKNNVLDEDPMRNLEMPSARWCFGCVKTVVRKDYLNNEICLT